MGKKVKFFCFLSNLEIEKAFELWLNTGFRIMFFKLDYKLKGLKYILCVLKIKDNSLRNLILVPHVQLPFIGFLSSQRS